MLAEQPCSPQPSAMLGGSRAAMYAVSHDLAAGLGIHPPGVQP